MMGNQMTAQAEHQAEQERMRRFQLGIQASEWDEKRQEREFKQKQLQALAGQYVPTASDATGGNGQPPLDQTGINVQRPPYQLGPTVAAAEDANRLSQMESGGRYDAIGPVANAAGNRAYGKYQVMDFNIGPWTQEVLGRAMTPQEFLADTKAQDAVFNAKFGAYKQKYGPGGAARAWFAGEGGMNNPNARDVLGTSVAGYERRFLGGGGSTGAPPPAGPLSMPQFATLPPFAGPGITGTIQPGATDQPTLVQGGGEGPTPQITLPPLGFDNRPPVTGPQPPAPPPAAPPQLPPPTAPTAAPPPQLTLLTQPILTPAQAQRLQAMVMAGNHGEAATEANRILTTQNQMRIEAHKQQYEQWTHRRGLGEKDAWAPLNLSDPLIARNYPGLDPSKPWQVNRVTGETKPIGGSQVQIDMGGKAVNEIGKQRFQQYEDKIRPAAQGAVTEIAAIHSFRQLLDAGAFTGAGAESKLWLARIAESLGVPNDKAGNTQVLMSAAAERVLASIKTLGANPTDADREYLAEARGGKISFTEDGLRKIIAIGERNARKIIDGHNSEVKRLRVLEGIKDIPQEFFQLDDVLDYETWSKANPLPKPQAQPPTGGTTPGGTGKSALDREIERRGKMGGG
jgi:hypothetical protein